jgi:conjugative transfer signal peptidase TraF
VKSIAFNRRSFLGVFAMGTALLLLILVLGTAGFRVNLTNSVPMGLYRVSSAQHATYVAFCLSEYAGNLSVQRGYRPSGSCPDGGAPFVKRVVAVSGDHVHLNQSGIAVNEVLLPNTRVRSQDRAGRPLQAWPSGDYTVCAGDLWVASTYNSYSYDSRYFGPISSEEILYGLESVLTLNAPE